MSYLHRFLIALTVVVLISGCGGGDGGEATTTSVGETTTTTAPPYSWPPEVTPISKDIDAAKSVSLRQTDLPEGWVALEQEPTTNPDDQDIDQAFVHCLFGPQPTPMTAYVVSPLMRSQSGNTIAQTFVRVVPSKEAAQSDFANFKATRVSTCMESMYSRQKSLSPPVVGRKFGDNPPGKVAVNRIVPPDNSKDTIGLRLAITPTDMSASYIDVYAYGVGRFEMVVLFQDGRTNPATADEQAALTAIKLRVAEVARANR